MQQHLVVWGDIGTDRKALITIELVDKSSKVVIHAFPQEIVTKQLQDDLFTKWKNGGEFTFPEDVLTWETDSNADNLLPPEITLHKPHVLVNAQRQWQKSVIQHQNFQMNNERIQMIKMELNASKEFNQKIWDETKALWSEILQSKKDGHIAWQDADLLKLQINEIFDGLKAFKRLNVEQNYEESKANLLIFNKQIGECIEKLVYPDEWNNIFEQLKKTQIEINKAKLTFKHKRKLYARLNSVFKDLRNYRKVDQMKNLKERIQGLNKVVNGLQNGINKDEESYQVQKERMQHYTKGKLSEADLEEQFKPLKDRVAGKKKKIKSIRKTIKKLEARLKDMEAPEKSKVEQKESKEAPKAESKPTSKIESDSQQNEDNPKDKEA